MKYLLATIIAFSTVFILTPILMKLAFKYNFTDKPTKRKKHKGETPLCGGIAMFVGFFLAYFIAFHNYSFDEKYGIFIGALLILIIGVVTAILSFIAVYIGEKLGEMFKSRAEIFGGIVLILIGLKILIEHLLK